MADITGLGAVADLASSVINKLFPDKSEQERQQLALTLTVIQGQLDANKVEAGSSSVFIGGWRPFIGWVCGVGCAWNWIGLPVALFVSQAINHPVEMRPADLSEMMPLLIGMLGLGAYRTAEKMKGVAS